MARRLPGVALPRHGALCRPRAAAARVDLPAAAGAAGGAAEKMSEAELRHERRERMQRLARGLPARDCTWRPLQRQGSDVRLLFTDEALSPCEAWLRRADSVATTSLAASLAAGAMLRGSEGGDARGGGSGYCGGCSGGGCSGGGGGGAVAPLAPPAQPAARPPETRPSVAASFDVDSPLGAELRGLVARIRSTSAVAVATSAASSPAEWRQHVESVRAGLAGTVACLAPEATTPTVAPRGAGECAICLEALGGTATARRLACGHAFHAACAAQWLQRRPRCPICRHSPFEPAPEARQRAHGP